MAGKDIVMLSRKEIKRLHVIKKVLDKTIKQVEAAEILLVSARHIRRIVRRVKSEGEAGIGHRSRGRPSNRRFPEEVKDRAIVFYRSKYKGFGPTFATEKLLEDDGIKLSDETLRKWLIQEGEWNKSRKRRSHRQWRQRKQHFGEMVQIDGSHHDWFEGRGPECVLIGYIDDATGNVFARFYGYEGTMPAMDSFKRYISKYGIPMSVYLDKHTTYKSTGRLTIEDELNDTKPLSEFERALKDLGVEVIHANSPQAKGRVERLFKTLQDRLVKEMRLKGTNTIEEANKCLSQYVPSHNRRFAISVKAKGNLHREIPKGIKLDKILCRKTERTLRKDFTIVLNSKLYQITDNVIAKKVLVEEKIDGSMLITHKDISLKFKEIINKPEKQQNPSYPRNTCIPPADHPWRKKFILPKTYKQKELGVQT
jgi:transposase